MHVVSGQTLSQWNALTDEQVIAHVLAGQTALFEVIMRRHNERLYRVARAIVRDDSEAEDVMQQAYVNAYAHLRQFNGQATFATWLTRIAANEAIGRLRRRGRYQQWDPEDESSEPDAPSAPDPERQAFAGELHDLLEAAVDRLPNGCREAFVLRQIEGLSTAETAACLSVSEEAVKTRLSRARAALRRDLSQRAGFSAHDVFSFHLSRCDRVVAAVFARIRPSEMATPAHVRCTGPA